MPRAAPRNDEAWALRCYDSGGATGERGRQFTETVKLVEEFDPSRPGVPETVAAAQAVSTRRRFFEVGRFPLWAPRRTVWNQRNE
jgi:hypothetical protein